jgi:mannose-6-phosphate isomerase-like protein (cupin superfamily)
MRAPAVIEPVNLREKFAKIFDCWNPRRVAELNGQHVRLVKFQGEFTWHRHDREDEMFFVIEGEFTMRLRAEHGGDRVVRTGEFIVIPRGVEHCPYAEREVQVMLFEPANTLNTGDAVDPRTRRTLESL